MKSKKTETSESLDDQKKKKKKRRTGPTPSTTGPKSNIQKVPEGSGDVDKITSKDATLDDGSENIGNQTPITDDETK